MAEDKKIDYSFKGVDLLNSIVESFFKCNLPKQEPYAIKIKIELHNDAFDVLERELSERLGNVSLDNFLYCGFVFSIKKIAI